jgi:hypothetical protein
MLKRLPHECRINNYNKNILLAWRANMDIQYILDPYACIVYIINYITKKEGQISQAVKQAEEETKEDNVKMKTCKIGNAILHNQEVSAEEAAHYLLGYPFTFMSTHAQFINTRPAEDSMRITKPVFNEKDDGTIEIEHVVQDNEIERYKRRQIFTENSNTSCDKGITLIDWIAWLTKGKGKNENEEEHYDSNKINHEEELLRSENINNQPVAENEESIQNNPIINDDTSHALDQLPRCLLPYYQSPHLKKKGYKFRSSPKIIRSCRFSEDKEPELHYRELMFLYTSWKCEADLKCNVDGIECSTYKEAYYSWKTIIDPIYNYYNGFKRIMEEAMLDNNESISDDEENMMEISATAAENANIIEEWERQEMEKQQFQPFFIETAAFLPETDDQFDIGNEMGFHNIQEQGMGAVAITLQSKTPEQIDVLFRKLNHQQQLFVANILKRVESESESEFIFLTGGPGVGKSEVL